MRQITMLWVNHFLIQSVSEMSSASTSSFLSMQVYLHMLRPSFHRPLYLTQPSNNFLFMFWIKALLLQKVVRPTFLF